MEPAAFKATFSDFRLVKGRKQAQFVFEVPLEQADKALDCLGGVPRSDNETWVGIAKLSLKDEAEKKPEKPRKRFDELPISQQCALTCADVGFQRWLNVSDEKAAAERVRIICMVESRSELDRNESAARLWAQINQTFLSETGRMPEARG